MVESDIEPLVKAVPRYSIILPTYNERENLPICIYLIDKYFKKSGTTYEVIVIDDNSPDNTAEIARILRKNYPGVRLHCRPGKLGLGTAYKAGLQFARAEYVFLMDADLSHHPKFIPEMIKLQVDNNVSSSFYSTNEYFLVRHSYWYTLFFRRWCFWLGLEQKSDQLWCQLFSPSLVVSRRV